MIVVEISFLKNYNGITLYPFLLVKSKALKNDPVFMNHERIHARQQLELLIVFFYLWYLLEYLILRVSKSHDLAYRSIRFEKEAYCMETELQYLKKRKPYAFLHY